MPELLSELSATEYSVATYPTIKESWGIIGWYILITLLLALPLYLLNRKMGVLSEQTTSVALSLLSSMALLFFLRWKARTRWVPVSFTGHEQVWLYAALPILVVALTMLLSLLDYLHLPNWMESFFSKVAEKPGLAFLGIGLVGPVLEELLFRGVILQGLLRNQRPWIAIGQSALLFGLIHINPAQSINAFLIGLLLGWLYYHTRSLWLCMATHALFNLLVMGTQILPAVRNADSMYDLFSSPQAYAGAVALSAGVFGVLLWRVYQTSIPLAVIETMVIAPENEEVSEAL